MSQIIGDEFEGGPPLSANYVIGGGSGYEIVSNSSLGGSFCVQQDESLAQRVFGKGPAAAFPSETELVTSGRAFHFSACMDHSWSTWSTGALFDGPSGNLLVIGIRQTVSPNVAPALLTVSHGGYDATTGFISLFKNTHPGGVTFVQQVTGVFNYNEPKVLTVEGEISTVTGGDEDGGGDAAFDGWVRIKVNGVTVLEHLNAQLGYYSQVFSSWLNVPGPFEYALFNALGRMDNLCLRDDLLDCGFTCAGVQTSTIFDLSDPCACNPSSSTGGGGGASAGSIPNPIGPLPAPTFTCSGGAPVEEVSDLAGLEACWQ